MSSASPPDQARTAATLPRAPAGSPPGWVASINEGEMSGLVLERIERWSPLKQEMVEGKPYWTVAIDYQADSIFGNFPARAKALIQGGQVVKWISAPR